MEVLGFMQAIGIQPAELLCFTILWLEIKALKRDLTIHEQLYHNRRRKNV